MIIGIDPGTTHSGAVVWVERTARVAWSNQAVPNEQAREWLRAGIFDGQHWVRGMPADDYVSEFRNATIVIEALSPRGQVVGWDTFKTIAWVGRLQEAAEFRFLDVVLIHRDEIKRELLGRSNIKAADSHIRQYLVDTIGPKGVKREPGPTFGVAGHAWQALGAVQAVRQQRQAEGPP